MFNDVQLGCPSFHETLAHDQGLHTGSRFKVERCKKLERRKRTMGPCTKQIKMKHQTSSHYHHKGLFPTGQNCEDAPNAAIHVTAQRQTLQPLQISAFVESSRPILRRTSRQDGSGLRMDDSGHLHLCSPIRQISVLRAVQLRATLVNLRLAFLGNGIT